MQEKLNLPKFNFKNRLVDNTIQIFDEVRKGYFKLTPEEWVRQHVINYLVVYKNYPIGLMQVEKLIKYNNLNTRADLIVNDRDFNPVVLVECKAPNVKIGKDAFDQIAKYNFSLKAKYLFVTNGLKHYCCSINYASGETEFLEDIPAKIV
ncbi:type I restriction enzyme HsdR N-terminal domain-containing protein [Flavobacteriales bacterium]|nr:type I restriction enzyme HsdR N-terminal domain-containing protein [Flavobacteriales bacterium]